MDYERRIISYFEHNNVPLKKNVKFFFDNNPKLKHEIDLVIPGYLIEIKKNFHFTNKSMRQIDKFYNLIPHGIKLCLICTNSNEVEQELMKEFPNIIVTNNPSHIKPITIHNNYYIHQNYLINLTYNNKNIYINQFTYDHYQILSGKKLSDTITVIDSYPDYNDFYLITTNKLSSKKYQYIISKNNSNKDELMRLFYHFYVKKPITNTHYTKPLHHNSKYTSKCNHGIYFHKYPCKKCLHYTCGI